ncbi:hypothetical protein [Sorangium sp. So ce1078]
MTINAEADADAGGSSEALPGGRASADELGTQAKQPFLTEGDA